MIRSGKENRERKNESLKWVQILLFIVSGNRLVVVDRVTLNLVVFKGWIDFTVFVISVDSIEVVNAESLCKQIKTQSQVDQPQNVAPHCD